MISENKYVGETKEEPLIIRSVGANNCDAVITDNGEYEAQPPFTGFGKVTVMVDKNPIVYPVGWIPRTVVDGELVVGGGLPDLTGVTKIGDYALYYACYKEEVSGNIDLSGIEEIGDYGFEYAFGDSVGTKTVNLSNLTTIGRAGCSSMFFNGAVEGYIDLGKLTTAGRDSCTQMFRNTGITGVNLHNLTTIDNYGCRSMFNNCTNLAEFDLSSLTAISGSYACENMFHSCNEITTVDLSNLTTVSGSYGSRDMFSNCEKIMTVDLSGLKTISSYYGCATMFQVCNLLSYVDLSALEEVSGQSACYSMFYLCPNLHTLVFNSLSSITGNGAFDTLVEESGITSISFPALTSTSFGTRYKNQFQRMLRGVTGCTIHFPSNLDPQTGSTVISGLTDYPNFGGTNTVLMFDLPATE